MGGSRVPSQTLFSGLLSSVPLPPSLSGSASMLALGATKGMIFMVSHSYCVQLLSGLLSFVVLVFRSAVWQRREVTTGWPWSGVVLVRPVEKSILRVLLNPAKPKHRPVL